MTNQRLITFVVTPIDATAPITNSIVVYSKIKIEQNYNALTQSKFSTWFFKLSYSNSFLWKWLLAHGP